MNENIVKRLDKIRFDLGILKGGLLYAEHMEGLVNKLTEFEIVAIESHLESLSKHFDICLGDKDGK